MKQTLSILMLILITGCESHLSPRETRTQNYSTLILALYDNPKPAAQTTALTAPMKLAIAQVGEIAPPQAMLDHLRSQPQLFSRIEGLPGVFEELAYQFNPRGQTTIDRQQMRDRVERLQRLSRDLGMDYLFLYGGSIDHYVRENPLQVLDLTIVGAFVVPSRQVRAVGKAAGALIDTRSGAIVFITSAESQETALASATTENGKEKKVLETTRDALTVRLADQLVERCREVALTRPLPLGN
jgi:rhombotail lipoprotein